MGTYIVILKHFFLLVAGCLEEMNASNNHLVNKTILENDPFSSIAEEDVQSFFNTTEFYNFLEIHETITRSISIMCCLISVAACIFLALIIIRYKKLRSSRMNISLLNTFILYSIHTPLALVTFYAELATLLTAQTYITVLMLYMLFSFLLGVEWLIIARKPHLVDVIHKCYTWIVAGVYLGGATELVLSFWYAKEHHIVRLQLLVVFYFVILLAAIILNVTKCCLKIDDQSTKLSYFFTCSNIMVFSILPLFVHHFLFYAFEYSYFVVMTSFIPELCFILHPVLVVYILGKRNKHFRTAYCKSLNFLRYGYDGEELEESESDAMKINSTQVNFSPGTEQLDTTENLGALHEVNLLR